jgi:hypothetical protein
MKNYQKAGHKMNSDVVNPVTLGNKNTERDFSESIKNNIVRTVDNLSKSGLSTELENVKGYNKKGKKIKPEEVRYIILRNKNPESKFRELKDLCKNVHWILVEEGSFLWRELTCNIDINCRYINETKCRIYDIEIVMEQSNRTKLLVAEPGVGKSTEIVLLTSLINDWKTQYSALLKLLSCKVLSKVFEGYAVHAPTGSHLITEG